jgi:RNA recognition motif-containing protein
MNDAKRRILICSNISSCSQDIETFVGGLQDLSGIKIIDYSPITTPLSSKGLLRLTAHFEDSQEMFKLLLDLNSESGAHQTTISAALEQNEYQQFENYLAPSRMYVGGFHKFYNFNSILETCKQFGTISHSNICFDKLGTRSGYVQYHQKHSAQRATSWLNGHNIRPWGKLVTGPKAFQMQNSQSEVTVQDIPGIQSNGALIQILLAFGQLNFCEVSGESLKNIRFKYQRQEDLVRFIHTLALKTKHQMPKIGYTKSNRYGLYFRNPGNANSQDKIRKFFENVTEIKSVSIPPFYQSDIVYVEFHCKKDRNIAYQTLNGKFLQHSQIELYPNFADDFESFYKVMVSNIPPYINVPTLTKIFSRCGNVADITMCPKSPNRSHQSAIVQFAHLWEPQNAVNLASKKVLSNISFFVRRLV